MQQQHRCVLHIVSSSDKNLDPAVRLVNTTSRSKEEWTKGLSPFFLGPVNLYGGFVAQNLENAWQYTKVYKEHVDPETGEPTEEYWQWAKEGWANTKAVRFPMGRGAKPEYSYWNGKKYGYISARKMIYAPLYASLVEKTIAFQKLKKLYTEEQKLYLWDFDGYDYVLMGRTLQQVIDDPNRKMGHAFVLAMLLRGEKLWETDDIPELVYDPKRQVEPQKALSGPQVSSGFLIQSAGLYLLCHATSREGNKEEEPADSSAYRKDGQWTISKGLLDEGETPLQAAIRELKEETGIDLLHEKDLNALIPPAEHAPINTYQIGKGAKKKTVMVFKIDDPQGLIRLKRAKELVCTSLIEGDYTPIHLRGLPELDSFAWVTAAEAHEMVFYSQKHLFSSI